jgi:hypothetical protein
MNQAIAQRPYPPLLLDYTVRACTYKYHSETQIHGKVGPLSIGCADVVQVNDDTDSATSVTPDGNRHDCFLSAPVSHVSPGSCFSTVALNKTLFNTTISSQVQTEGIRSRLSELSRVGLTHGSDHDHHNTTAP